MSNADDELRGMAHRYGAKRVYDEKGIGSWRFPAWFCIWCTSKAGPDALVQEGCPDPLARHGPVKDRGETEQERS